MDFNKLIENHFLNIIYNNKYKTILKASMNNQKLIEKKHNNYISILYAIDNIPPCFNSTRKNIKTQVDNYISINKKLDYYRDFEFYKSGFIDGYKFLSELQKQEGKDETNE